MKSQNEKTSRKIFLLGKSRRYILFRNDQIKTNNKSSTQRTLNKHSTEYAEKNEGERGNNETKAIKDFTNILEIDSLDTHAYIYRSKAYKEKKEYIFALDDLEEAIRLEPTLSNKELLFDMAFLNKKIENYGKAIELYEKSIESNNDTEAMFAIAGLYSIQNKKEESLKWVEKTINSDALYSKKIKKSKEFKKIKKNEKFKSLINI